MSVESYEGEPDKSFWRAALSPTVAGLYVPLIVMVAVVAALAARR
ncbi:MAG TPA: hypothetical protein VLI67_00035 [Vicinamibacteria bacterium]|nr:hypothetical protein [Vicinamibacteria bacterium]